MKQKIIWIRIVLAFFIILGSLIVGYEWMVWSFSRVSDNFKNTAYDAFLVVKECEEHVEQLGNTFEACIQNAEAKLAVAHSRTETTADRGIYYSLNIYRKAIEVSHHDWQTGDTSPEAKQRHDEMISRRDELMKILRH